MRSLVLTRLFLYLAGFVAMLGCERLAPFARSGQEKPRRVLFHLGLAVANSVVLYLVMGWPLLAAVEFGARNETGLARILGLGGWGEILATLIVFDCWDYWMHRANHRIALLWRFHKAHHSDMELDVTTAARFHIGELIISGSVKSLVILAWGPSLAGLAVFEAVLNASSQFHHGNLGLPRNFQDRLETYLVTPRMHRCHHALHRHCVNTNFSTTLSIWDRLFGSYHLAGEPVELEPIGLSAPRGPETMELAPFLLTPFRKP